jgi:hypothetical protein
MVKVVVVSDDVPACFMCFTDLEVCANGCGLRLGAHCCTYQYVIDSVYISL